MTGHRLKTYSGEGGYVYQYYFLESQPRKRWWSRIGTAFLFHVTRDRRNFFVVEVLVEDSALDRYRQVHGRALVETEQYAAAKMRLFRAFDENQTAEDFKDVRVSHANIESLLEPLHLDG